MDLFPQLVKPVPKNGLAVFGKLEPRIFVAKGNVIVVELQHHGVVAVGQHQSHLALFLGYDGHGHQVVDIYKRGAQEIVARVNEDGAVRVLDAILAVLLKHLVKPYIFFHHALHVEVHGFLVGHHFHEIVVRIAVVCHRAGYEHAPVEIGDNLAVEVNVFSHGTLALRDGERLHSLFNLLQHGHRATCLDVTVDLPSHFHGKELIQLL